MGLRTYDPKDYDLDFLGGLIDGFADDTFIEIEASADWFELDVGAGGDVSRTRLNDRSANCKITLKQTAAANDFLAAALALDDAAGTGVGPFILKDRNGTTVVACANAFIKKPANVGLAKSQTPREWEIILSKTTAFVPGSTNLPA